MKSLLFAIAISLAFFGAGALPVFAQEGYTFITTDRGAAICFGRWITAADPALPGHCDGQVLGLSELTAISSKQSVDRLDQLLGVMSAIDQRLAENNEQIGRLIQVTSDIQSAIDRQVNPVSEFLRETINRKFAELTDQTVDDHVRQQIERLKSDILAEVERRYPSRPLPPKK